MKISLLPTFFRAVWFAVAVLFAGATVRANSIQWNSINLGGLNANNQHEGGRNLEITLNVTNTGGDTWNGAHNLVMRAPNGEAMAMAGIDGVSPGQSVTTTIVWQIPEAGGTHTFTVEALEHEVEYFSVGWGQSFTITAIPETNSDRVFLAPSAFSYLDKPTISTNPSGLAEPYRLRAKVINGSSHGLHMAHQWNNHSFVVENVPPPGIYAVTALYWVKYTSLYGAVSSIGPERRQTITVRDTVYLAGGSPGPQYFHELEPPRVMTPEMMGGYYRMMATFRSGADSWETAGELSNNNAVLKWLPPPGSYSVGLRWKRYDNAMNLSETSPEKIVTTEIVAGLTRGLDIVDGSLEEITWTDEDSNTYYALTSWGQPFSVRVPGAITVSLTSGYTGAVRNAVGNYLGSIPGTVNLPAAGDYSVEVSGSAGAFQIFYSFTTPFQPPQITSAATASPGGIGAAHPGYVVTASGTAPLTFSAPPSDVAGGLPPGLSLDPDTGAITGTPTAGGIYRVWISASNVGGRSGKWVTFAIKAVPILPIELLTQEQLTKTNGDLKLTVTASMLPPQALAPAAGMPAPTGTIQYSLMWISHEPGRSDYPTALANLPVYPNPWATLRVTAAYAGDANYLPATKTVEFKVVDTLPPEMSSVLGFVEGSKTSTGFSLTWNPIPDMSGALFGRPFQGVTYQVSLDSGPPSVPSPTPGASFNGLIPGSSHTVRVMARDHWGYPTAWSPPYSVDLPMNPPAPSTGSTGVAWADINGDGLPDELIPAGERFTVSEIAAYTDQLTFSEWVQDVVSLPGTWQFVDTVRRLRSSDGGVIQVIEPAWVYVPGMDIPYWTTEQTTVSVEMVMPTYEFVAVGGDTHAIVQEIPTTQGKKIYGVVVGGLIFGNRGSDPQSVFYPRGTIVASHAMQAFPTKLARLGTPPTGAQVSIPGLPGGGNIEVHAGTSGVSGTMTLPNGITIRAGGGNASISMKGSAGSITVGSNGTISGQADLPGGWSVSGGTDGNATITGPDGQTLRVGSGGTTLSLPNGAGITVSNTGAVSLSLPAGLGGAIGGVLDDLGRVLGLPPGNVVRRAVIPQGSTAPVIWENGDGGLASLPPGNYSVGSSPDNRTQADGQTMRTPAPTTVVWISLEVRSVPPQIVVQETQLGRIGDYVSSSLPSGMRHFVTAKSTPELPDQEAVFSVVGIAASEIGAGKTYQWEGGVPSGSDSAKRAVSRAAATMEDLKIVKASDGQVVCRLRVWVVWTTITATQGIADFDASVFSEPGKRWAIRDTSSVLFRFSIQPFNIIDSQAAPDRDRPALGGTADQNRPVPGWRIGNWHAISVNERADSAPRKWDLSRRARVTIRNPSLIQGLNEPAAFYLNQPKSVDVPIQYPFDPVEGNDDPETTTASTNPYSADNSGYLLGHPMGQMASSDRPVFVVYNRHGSDLREFGIEAEFQEFARLQIWDGSRASGRFWFRISNYFVWTHRLKTRHIGGEWVNDGSSHTLEGEIP